MQQMFDYDNEGPTYADLPWLLQGYACYTSYHTYEAKES